MLYVKLHISLNCIKKQQPNNKIMNDYTNKDGQLSKAAKYALKNLCLATSWGKARKVSDFYMSRSTRLPNIYVSALFIISSSRSLIAEAGYAKTCKAVIIVNMDNQAAAEYVRALNIQSERAKEQAQENDKKRIEAEEHAKAVIEDFFSCLTPEQIAAELQRIESKDNSHNRRNEWASIARRWNIDGFGTCIRNKFYEAKRANDAKNA